MAFHWRFPLCLLVLLFSDSLLALTSGLTNGTTIPPTSSTLPTITWIYNHSSTIDHTIDISHNRSGSAYAFACQAASASYDDAESKFLATRVESTIPLFLQSALVTKEFWDVWTTDCDGIPHVRGTTPTSANTFWNTTTLTNIVTALESTLHRTSPTCFIQPSDCKVLQQSYSKETEALDSFTKTLTPPYYIANEPADVACTTSCSAAQMCMIQGDEVRLIYWPVTTTGADSCRAHGTTVPSNITTVQSIVSLGTTFVSPSVYISFRSLWAWDWGCYTTIGRPISHTILAVDPKSLSSAQGWHLGRSAVSFNLADLNGFVSSKAFFQMQPYDWFPRETIYDDLYNPIIWMPDEVLSMRSEWKSCDLSIFGIQDPPLALQTEAYLTRPGAKPTSAPPASPASSVSDSRATATPTAIAEHQSKTKSAGGLSSSARQETRSTGHPQTWSRGSHGWGHHSRPEDPSDFCGTAGGWNNYARMIARAFGMVRSESCSPHVETRVDSTQGPVATSAGQIPSAPASVMTSAEVPLSLTRTEASSAVPISIGSQGVICQSTTVAFSAFGADSDASPGRYYGVATDSASSSYVMVAGSTMYVSGLATTLEGHTISVQASGVVMDGSQTIPFSSNAPSTTASTSTSAVATELSTGAAPPGVQEIHTLGVGCGVFISLILML